MPASRIVAILPAAGGSGRLRPHGQGGVHMPAGRVSGGRRQVGGGDGPE